MDIRQLLELTVSRGGSDLHLTVGSRPCIRIHGSIERTEYPDITSSDIHQVIYDILTDEQKARFEESHDLDLSLELTGVGRFRCNIFSGRLGEGAVFRVIPTKIKSIEELGLPQVINSLTEKERGLILVTGPTGSGKSTTLAAMIDVVNISRKAHILTIEDPIEFVHPHKSCIVNQREVGPHTNSFATALRAALREDPDVILVGELRDFETIGLAVTAAETGHLVFGTLHTSSAAQTVDRIIDVFPPHQQAQVRSQLSESLQGVVSQTLVPSADGRGRVAVVEVMTGTNAVRNLIREGKTFQLPSIIQTSTSDGMQSKDQHLRDLVKMRKISVEDAYKIADDKSTFMQSISDVQNAVTSTQSAPPQPKPQSAPFGRGLPGNSPLSGFRR